VTRARVLLAGATGVIGRALLPMLRDAGFHTRTLSRSSTRARALPPLADEVVVADATKRRALVGVTSDIDVVVSCIGASVDLRVGERAPFSAVDTAANANLVSLAVTSAVRRFVYVAAFTEPAFAETGYVAAHEAVVRRLRDSGMPFSIVRPTGLFPTFRPLLPMAARGRIVVIGDGHSRTNPVHPEDVARTCLGVIEEGPFEIPLGGPDVLTRGEIARMAFSIVGVPPKLSHVAPWVSRAAGRALRVVHPRLGQLVSFATEVSVVDAIAPKVGTRRLEDYLREEWTAMETGPGRASLAPARDA
jgi:uncharacterized protein YbjT (DUF2867 family)